MICKQDQSFISYFEENMNALGLPAPTTLFGTAKAAMANAALIIGTIEKLGASTTIAEVIGAGTGMEVLATIGFMGASYYVGAVIGSLVIATQRFASCGASLTDVIQWALRNGLNPPWLRQHLAQNREIYDRRTAARSAYALKAYS